MPIKLQHFTETFQCIIYLIHLSQKISWLCILMYAEDRLCKALFKMSVQNNFIKYNTVHYYVHRKMLLCVYWEVGAQSSSMKGSLCRCYTCRQKSTHFRRQQLPSAGPHCTADAFSIHPLKLIKPRTLRNADQSHKMKVLLAFSLYEM